MKKLICMVLLLFCIAGRAQTTQCVNPVIWADVPDPDVIRVGDTFYMVSTTMHLMPGAPIMRSKDLVHWEIISYIFPRLTDSPKYDMHNGTVYGFGQWATSLKYHNGAFYALFAPNDNPGGDSYIYTTKNPAGTWTLVSRMPHFHDSSFLFDDDGRVYVFHGTGMLTELNPDLKSIKKDGINMTLFKADSTETGLLEGSRAIKYNGKYYLLMISWPTGGKRRQVCYRADKITGPYEKQVILESKFGGFSYVGQGTIVDDEAGNWYGMIFQDRGGVGRVLTLSPCKWINGWPMIGDDKGQVPEKFTLPLPTDNNKQNIVSSDDFNESSLKLCWQWNHNPIDKAWSLKERRGFLRLRTSRVADNVYIAPNTISQRMMGPRCSAVVAIDISKMRNGDKAGFAAFNGDAGLLTISRSGNRTALTMQTAVVNFNDNKVIKNVDVKDKEGITIRNNKIFLRIDADFNVGKDIATFYYSVDNRKWTKIGTDFKMIYDYRRLFMGTRFAIFNYATKTQGGYIDVDFLHYKVSSTKDGTSLVDK
jgi:beta-xylosidase